MKNPTIIFRATNSCNLECKYCYDKKNHISMNEENEEFELKIPKIIEYISVLWRDKNIKSEIIFHGGEPLVINADNYDALMGKIKEMYPKAKFSIQTNATLINEKNIRILKKYNVNIGISLDGFNEQTNCYRVYKNGKNSFENVMKKIELLKENDINFGIIMTLTNSVKGREKEFYEFIGKNNLKCNMRPAFECGQKCNEYMKNEDYYEFFKNLFNIWIEDKQGTVKLTQIKELYDEFICALQPNYRIKSCSTSGNCFKNFISLDRMGNLYSCNRVYQNKEFFYGNIEELDMKELEEKINNEIKERNKYIQSSKCKSCKIYNNCRGGCPANAYSIYGTRESIDDSFCVAKVKIKEYINEYLDKNKIREEYEEMKKDVEKLYK